MCAPAQLSHPVARGDGFDLKVARCEIADEAHLCLRAEACAYEVGNLGHHQSRDDERGRMGPQEIEAGRVMPVVGVDIGVERAGVNDQCDDDTSDARISSMRSDTSARPLRPAAAAPSRRRGPRWLSMASLVSSEMVIPRRCASWRSGHRVPRGA